MEDKKYCILPIDYEYNAPKITFSDKTFTPLNVVKQSIEVEVSDVIARVRTFMHFVNKQNQTLEGELQFYLPPDATVSKVSNFSFDKFIDFLNPKLIDSFFGNKNFIIVRT